MSHSLLNKQLHWQAIKVSAVIGTLLCLINYGNHLIDQNMASSDWLKLALTYCVPYAVSLYSTHKALHSAAIKNTK